MPFVTAGMDQAMQPLSYAFEAREDALIKAVELAKMGAESVSVTDIETGDVLTGEEIISAVEQMAQSLE